MTIIGNKAMLVFDNLDTSEPIRIYYKHIDKHGKLHNDGVNIPAVDLSEPLYEECKYFVNCIKTNSKPLSSLEESRSVIEVIDTIRERILL
jgi:predicted dehydrogenase